MRRRTGRRVNCWASLVVVVALALLANYFGGKYWVRDDWSRARFHSLSPRTATTLRELDRPLRLVSLLSPTTGEVEERVFEELRTILLAFSRAAPERVTLEERDPLRDPAFAQALLRGPGTGLRSQLNVVVVEIGERRREIGLDEMVVFDTAQAAFGPPPVRALTLEGALLDAIEALSREERPLLRFATGHGEVSPHDAAAPVSYASFRAALEAQDLRVGTWEALGASGSRVPEGTDLVVVAAPSLAWDAGERAALEAYLAAGGRLLLLVEPRPDETGEAMAVTGLEPLLAHHGVRLVDGLALDPAAPLLDFGAEVFYALVRPGHPIGDAAADQPLIFNLARPIVVELPVETGVRAHALVESSRDAWGETDLRSLAEGAIRDDGDEAGPLTLAAAIERESDAGAARLVVIADASLPTDETLGAYAHRPFLLAAVRWLLDDEPGAGLPPKDRNLTQLFLDAGEQANLALLVLVALPALPVVLGLATWWRRRRA